MDSYRDGFGRRNSLWWLKELEQRTPVGSLGLHWDVLWYELGQGDQAELCVYKTLFSVLLPVKTTKANFSLKHYCVLGSESSALNKLFS